MATHDEAVAAGLILKQWIKESMVLAAELDAMLSDGTPEPRAAAGGTNGPEAVPSVAKTQTGLLET